MKYITYSLAMTVLFVAEVCCRGDDVDAVAKRGRGKRLTYFLQDGALGGTGVNGAGKGLLHPASARRNFLPPKDDRGHRSTGAGLVLLKKKFLIKFYILAKLFIYGAIAKAKFAMIVFKVLLFVTIKFLALAAIHTAMAVYKFYYQYKIMQLFKKDMFGGKDQQDIRNQQDYGGWNGGGSQDAWGWNGNRAQNNMGWSGNGAQNVGRNGNGAQNNGGWSGNGAKNNGGWKENGAQNNVGWNGNGAWNNVGWNGNEAWNNERWNGGGGTGYSSGEASSMGSNNIRQRYLEMTQ